MSNRRNTLWLLINIMLLVGLFTGQAIFFSMAYLFGSLMVVSFIWARLAVRGVRMSRRTRTRRAQVGRNFSEQFSVRNTSIIPKLWLEVRDHSTLPDHRASHVIPPMLPMRSYEWRANTLCRVRGEFQLGPMTVISGDPFGLFLTPRRINASERMIVYPATAPITQFKLSMGLLPGGEPQRTTTQAITTNVAGVRDYVPGDSIKRIHWKNTARLGRLMVKEYELDPLGDVWLMVDFSVQSLVEMPSVRRIGNVGTVIPNSSGIPDSTEEYGVIVAASLTEHFTSAERPLGFVAYTPNREVLQPERGHRQMTRILEILAVARSRSERTMQEMIALETPYIKRGASIIVVTSSLDPAWIAEVQMLARRGIRPMCILIDPTSFGVQASTEPLMAALQGARIPLQIVRKDDNITLALAQRPV